MVHRKTVAEIGASIGASSFGALLALVALDFSANTRLYSVALLSVSTPVGALLYFLHHDSVIPRSEKLNGISIAAFFISSFGLIFGVCLAISALSWKLAALFFVTSYVCVCTYGYCNKP